jgi:hypothetical protein
MVGNNAVGVATSDAGAVKSRLRYALLALLLLAAIAFSVLLATESGRFYLKFPSMSWDAFNDIIAKAKAGDAENQMYYGVFFANGDGVGQS